MTTIFLEKGYHTAASGKKCVNEFGAWLAGESHTDMPHCYSVVYARVQMRLNDRPTGRSPSIEVVALVPAGPNAALVREAVLALFPPASLKEGVYATWQRKRSYRCLPSN